MAWAPDGSNRLFICEKSNGVRVIKDGTLLATAFATFPQLYTNSECGVLGICFDNNYAQNKFVYVFVTVSSSEQRIVRFTDLNNIGSARTTIMSGLPTLGQNHDGGALAMGSDGKIYFAIGDNGDKRGVDGNLTSLAAKVGRCNADGSVPNDNPFNDGSGPQNDYIYATGFRNPFTMTFQPGTGKLWLNVVGSDSGGQTEPNSGPGYEQVFVVHPGDDGGYDDFEGNQPASPRYTTPFTRPMIRPKIQYKTTTEFESGQKETLSAISRANSVVTFTTTGNHHFRVGQAVVVKNASADLNGTYTVNAVLSSTGFTAPSPGANASANSGSVEPLIQGSAISGGTFYSSTAFPAAYRGNFFYGDYTGGRLMRAQLDANDKPVAITVFVDQASVPIDCATGPDGALYYTEIGSGNVQRVAFDGVQGFVVSPTVLGVKEGGSAQFTVRLGTQPLQDVTVQIHKTGDDGDGSHDLAIAGADILNFTPENFNEPQAVTISALEDVDTNDDTATFAVTAPGFDPVEVNATATDENLPDLVLSTNAVTVDEGSKVDVQVSLPAAPAGSVKVRVRPTAGATGRVTIRRGALLRFTPENFATPQTIRFKAEQDLDKKDQQVTFTISAKGYRSRTVTVVARDNDPSRPKFTTTPGENAVVNLQFRYDADARGLPLPAFSLVDPPDGMIIDPQTGMLSWTPDTLGQFTIRVRATNTKGFVDQEFTLNVNADQPPTAFITLPTNGATVSGTHAEFFGGSLDDYQTYKAEFYIDGQLAYTDLNREAHYHLNGAHNLFDTTQLSNGSHTLKMKVYDDLQQTGEEEITVMVAN